MRALLLCTSLAAGACASVDAEVLYESGPSQVGYARVDVTYASPGTEEERVIPVDVWYPATIDGEALVTYKVAGIVSRPSTVAHEGAAPAGEEPAPFMVYSHGSGGQGLLAYAYAEHLASHGWVVAAPDHLGNTASDFVNGSAAPRNRSAIDRPLDLHAVIDASEDGFGVGVDVRSDETLVFGHSFGGYTALSVAGMKLDVDALLALCVGGRRTTPTARCSGTPHSRPSCARASPTSG